MVTPRDPARRGCQLSVRVGAGSADELAKRLRHEHGVIADAREPDIVRFAPVPLYSHVPRLLAGRRRARRDRRRSEVTA